MTKILIDARLYGPKHTGIGRYTKNLLIHLTQTPYFSEANFSLIVDQDQLQEVKIDLGDKYKLIPTTIKPYSITEQLILPFVLYQQRADLVHFTHFNKPVLYFGKSVVTIHDLIKHFYKGRDTTTKNQAIFWIKYIAYLIVTFFSIKFNYIIVPSQFWQKYLIKNFNINSNKIITTHEAVDPNFLKIKRIPTKKPDNYIIYTGNLYPHKNFEIILKALQKLPKIKLKIICARDIFQQRAVKTVNLYHLSSKVEFLGFLQDKQFKNVYRNALSLVHPSFMEGFSLTGLEAMALSCPVISSDASCLPEIYQQSVLYFNPNNPDSLIKQIKTLLKSSTLRSKLISKGYLQVDKYSWLKTAKKTVDFYQKINETS